MTPDVCTILGRVRNLSVGNPAVGVEPEQPERPLQSFAVPQFDGMAPLYAVEHHGGLYLRWAYSGPVPRIHPPARLQLNYRQKESPQGRVGHGPRIAHCGRFKAIKNP